MRLLQINPNGDADQALDLHPLVTIVQGLSPAGREAVLRAFEAVPVAGDPGCHGLIEAHGVLMDLSVENLRLLDLHDEHQVVVRSADLPGAGNGGGGIAARRSVSRDEIERFIVETPEGVYPALDAARAAAADGLEARRVLTEAVERAREAYDEAAAKSQDLAVRLAALTDARPGAHLRLVGEADADAGDEPAADGTEGEGGAEPEEPAMSAEDIRARRSELEALLEGLAVQQVRVERGLEELAGLDVRPLQVLLDAIHNPAPIEMVPSERANELADEFVRLQQEVGVLEQALEAKGMDTATALARLDAANAELAAAEKSMRPPEFTDQDRLDLEAAHDEVLEAESKARGKAGRKRLDEALERERAVLDKMGFPTWSAYVMGASLMGIDPAAEARVEQARFEQEAANAHWGEVTSAIEADPVHRQLLDELEAVYLEAFDLLGGEEPPDLEIALRELQIPKREISLEELADALAYQLELLGMPLDGSPSIDHVVMVAEAFLEEASAVTARIVELETEQASIAEQTAAATAELEALPEVEDEDPFRDLVADEPTSLEVVPSPFGSIDGDAFSDGSGDGDDESDGDDAPDEESGEAIIAQLEQDLEIAREDEAEYLELVDARQALMDAAIQVAMVAESKVNRVAAEILDAEADAEAEAAATADGSTGDEVGAVADEGAAFSAEAVEFFLVSRLSELRNVSYAGSVPLVIDEALEGLDGEDVQRILGKLAPLSTTVQIVVLSDDAAAGTWADEVGFGQAAIVPAPPAFA